MAAGIRGTIVVRGVPETVRRFRKLSAEVESRVRALVKKTAANVKRDAQDKAPVLTGGLRRSISRRTIARGLAARVGTRAPHAAVIEFGAPRRNLRPRPFLFPALDRGREGFQRELLDIVERKAPQAAARGA